MTVMKISLKATLIATAIAALPLASHAAGLGAIHVHSGLGQPLRAEIELNATPQELQTLAARVPSVEVFRQANVSYSPVMAGVQLNVEQRGDRSVLRVTSSRPVHEPFVDLLVEVQWADGRLQREYTFLLDPVGFTPPATVTAPPPARVAAPPAVATAPQAAAQPSTRVAGTQYRVRRGDTLRGIAAAHRPSGTNLDQVLLALLQQNPAAFDDGNVNRLRAGAILTIPDQATVQSIDPARARGEIVAQAADFEAYRNRLAGVVAQRPATPAVDATRESAGEIAPRVTDVPRPDVPQDRVEVSGAPTAEGGDLARVARLQALEEELVAREQSLEEANSRLAELEQSIRELQRLIELRNQGLAQLQQQLATGELTAGVDESSPAEQQPRPEDPLPEVSPVAVAEPADVDALEGAGDTGAIEAPMAELAQAPTVSEVIPETPAAQADTPPVRPDPLPLPASPTLLETLLDDPKMLAGGAGILALLLGYAGYRSRRRRKDDAGVETITEPSERPSEAKSVFGSKGGQSVDTGSSSVLHTDFSQSGMSAIDADEGVDPVAEADVYMAYGRDAQAEEILLDALKADASRTAIYLKLLEIYAQRNSPRQFEAVATDLYSRTGGQGSDWIKAAEMGRKLDPDNPLYQSNVAADDAGAARRSAAATGVAAATGAAATIDIVQDNAAGSDGLAANALDDLDFTLPADDEPVDETWELPASDEDVAADRGVSLDEHLGADAAKDRTTDTADGLPDVDFSVLDFDLGSDADASPELAKQTDEPSQEGSATAADDLMLDLDIDEELSAGAASVLTDAGSASAADDTFQATLVDEPLDFGASIEEFEAEPEPEPASAERVADAVDNELGVEWSFDDDKPEVAEEVDLSETIVQSDAERLDDDVSVTDLEQTEFDNQLLDFDFDLDGTAGGARESAPVLDLSSIDLDLDVPDEPVVAPQETPLAAAAEVDVPEPAPEMVQEVDTKLDLARAYEEMGDKEGARELIEEVLREGSVAQREAAGQLLERLG